MTVFVIPSISNLIKPGQTGNGAVRSFISSYHCAVDSDCTIVFVDTSQLDFSRAKATM